MNFKHHINTSHSISVALFLCILICCTQVFANDSAGKTIMAKGEVNAINPNSGARALARREPVFMIDRVSTGQLSATQLRMIDGALLSLQQDTELIIAEYQFKPQAEQSSITLSLLKGGLRTVTGALNTETSNYRLDTPIASIGVRGTHYEAELFENDLYLAGWQGIIDITVSASNQRFSLGPEQDYRFAIVRSDGDVEFLIQAPVQFTAGHSNEPTVSMPQSETAMPQLSALSSSLLQPEGDTGSPPEVDSIGETYIDNQQLVARLLPGDIGVTRSGSAIFDQLESSNFSSTQGDVSDLSIALTVNFDTATIPTGNMSFNDAQGEWFAAFNGFIVENSLDLNINFAAHNNALANGSISALFIDGANGVFGNVSLFEVNRPDISAGGSFILTERRP